MGKIGKAVAIALLVVLFLVPTMIIGKTWAVWSVFWGYVEGLEDLTGISHYILTALALIMFVPYYIGTDMLFSFRGLVSQRRRYMGGAILLAMAVGYNLSLYYVTREMAFAFSGGSAQKWYAMTPDGVRYYNRPGFDTTYGIPVHPVTPEIIPKLKLLEKGEFKSIDPDQKALFNPITGQPQVWYYKYPEGKFEFYDKPGFHPVTGTPLKPITEQVYFEWRKTQKIKPSEDVVREPQKVKPQEDMVKERKSGIESPSVESSGTTKAALPRKSGIYPVEKTFGSGGAKTRLFSIEMVEGGFLRFNFVFEWVDNWFGEPVDLYLDSPKDTTFLVDQFGRQHSLVQAAEISADRPVEVPSSGSKRFTLTFPIPPEMESFKYQATLFMRSKKGNEGRLHIRSEKGINLKDFRVSEPQKVKLQESVVKERKSGTEPPSVESSGTTTSVVPPKSGLYPVGREFKEMTGIGNGIVHLHNIEIIDGRLLRFNFDFSWEIPSWNSNPVDVYLDNPVDTTFLLDRLGRQHPLVQTAEISAERPMGVSPRSSKRFTMTFSFPSDMESFKYQAILLVKIKGLNQGGYKSTIPDQFRLHIRAEKEIKLTDFR